MESALARVPSSTQERCRGRASADIPLDYHPRGGLQSRKHDPAPFCLFGEQASAPGRRAVARGGVTCILDAMDSLRRLGSFPLPDPARSRLVVEPPGGGPGFWAGGPSAVFDPDDGLFYLSYRLRRPLGSGRGGVTRVARSEDGFAFTTIWEAGKDDFGTTSIGESAVFPFDDVMQLATVEVDGAARHRTRRVQPA